MNKWSKAVKQTTVQEYAAKNKNESWSLPLKTPGRVSDTCDANLGSIK